MMDPLSLDDAVSRYMDQPVLCSSGPGAQVFEAYDAEFGYELYQGPPRLWAMCAISSVEVRSVCDGMQPFYRFADLSRACPVNCSRNVSNPLNNFGRQHSPPARALVQAATVQTDLRVAHQKHHCLRVQQAWHSLHAGLGSFWGHQFVEGPGAAAIVLSPAPAI